MNFFLSHGAHLTENLFWTVVEYFLLTENRVRVTGKQWVVLCAACAQHEAIKEKKSAEMQRNFIPLLGCLHQINRRNDPGSLVAN